MMKPGTEVRLRTRGTILSIQGKRALIQWSSGSVSHANLASLEEIPEIEGKARSADPEAGSNT